MPFERFRVMLQGKSSFLKEVPGVAVGAEQALKRGLNRPLSNNPQAVKAIKAPRAAQLVQDGTEVLRGYLEKVA